MAKAVSKTKETNEAPLAAAAAAVVDRDPTPGDEPAEVSTNPVQDFDALGYDATDVDNALSRRGFERDPNMAYRWCNTRPQMFDRRTYEGWVAVHGGKIRRNELMLCAMPKQRQAMHHERLQKKNAERANAGMNRFASDAAKIATDREVSVIEGDSGPMDGIR